MSIARFGTGAGLSWFSIVRLGFVQAAIGSMVMLSNSLLNRLMVVEYGLAATIPAGLVAWHYAVQLSRPAWGHGSDQGRQRTPWIIMGMAILAFGALMAVNATVMMGQNPLAGMLLAIIAFTLIGAGVGAAGTSMLALLATAVHPGRRSAAAAVTWIMMIAGIVISAISAGALLDPFSESRLALVTGGVVLIALLVSYTAIFGVERKAMANAPPPEATADGLPPPSFKEALADIWSDPSARRFTLFVFVSMLAYNMQELILEPFAGQIFAMTPGESTSLSGQQNAGVLTGMIIAGIGGSAFSGRRPSDLRWWIVLGCLGSALALAALSYSAQIGLGWPITANVFALGFFNGMFAVAAIGSMMGLAGAGARSREGIRMGVWGAAQAIAFGLGGLIGAVGVDVFKEILGVDSAAYQTVFAAEGVLFAFAAMLAVRATGKAPAASARLAAA